MIFLMLLALIAVVAPFLAGDVPILMKKDGRTFLFPNAIGYNALISVDFGTWRPSAANGEWAVWPPIPFSPYRTDLFKVLEKPGRTHLLGTDNVGRDVLSRLIWGARISMTVGFVAMGISVAIGVLLGCLAGYYGGWADAVILRVIEVVLCFPLFILILAIMAFLPPSIYNVMVVLGLFGWTSIARLVRGEFLKLRESDFATAARATGLTDARIMFRHLLPNALSPVLVAATFGVASAILAENALTFLGFGVPPPAASWGQLLSQAYVYLFRGAWWLVVYPGLAIFATVTAFNLVGEGLQDAMDPRLRQ
ncbi:MAG: peptide ABC transporter permease [Candidatus Hydrogenedentota bacterium]